MTKSPQKKFPIQRFLEWAKGRVAAKDRGTLADLRRGFSPGTEHRAWRHIALYCDDLSNDKERIIWQTVAAGFATHEATMKAGNMGRTMRQLALEGNNKIPKSESKTEDALKSFDARFRRLLTCHTSIEICERLPGIIRAAKSKNSIPIDFETLYIDLKYWGEQVKLRWASSYWGGTPDKENSTDTEPPSSDLAADDAADTPSAQGADIP